MRNGLTWILLLIFWTPALAAQSAADVQVSPPDVEIPPGGRVQVGASAYTESGDAIMGAAYRWSTTDSAVVRIIPGGAMGIAVLVGVAPGSAIIEARSGKGRGFGTVQVLGADPAAPPAEAPATAEVRRRLATCAQLMRPPAAGSWAEWKTPKGTVKLALLGMEEQMGMRMYRIEIAADAGAETPGMVMQLVSPGWPYLGQRLFEVLIQAPGRPVRRLSAQQLASTRLETPPDPLRLAAARCKEMTNLGPVPVTVPAGSFTAHHFRDPEGDLEFWIDPGVPFGLVRTTGKGNGEIVLVARGTDARSTITARPDRN